MHNFVYKPEVNQDHYMDAQDSVNILHLSIDRLYYSQLLCDKERWQANLKEKLLNKQPVSGTFDNMQMTPNMFGVVHDILNCSLSGNLRKIVIEAKVLELVASIGGLRQSLEPAKEFRECPIRRTHQIALAMSALLHGDTKSFCGVTGIDKTQTTSGDSADLARHKIENQF